MVGRLRQAGHMEIAWQHVGVVVLSRREECWVLGSGREDGGRGGGGRRSEECSGG